VRSAETASSSRATKRLKLTDHTTDPGKQVRRREGLRLGQRAGMSPEASPEWRNIGDVRRGSFVALTFVLFSTTTAAQTAPNQANSALAQHLCEAKDMRADAFARKGFVFQPTGSSATGAIWFSRTGRTTCVLSRRIRVRFVAPRHGQRVHQVRMRLEPGTVVARRLRPHEAVLLQISWSNWCGPGSDASTGRSGALPRALVIFAGSSRPLLGVSVNGTPPCNGRGPSIVGVTPFVRVVHPVG
jgi:hypothetical protein